MIALKLLAEGCTRKASIGRLFDGLILTMRTQRMVVTPRAGMADLDSEESQTVLLRLAGAGDAVLIPRCAESRLDFVVETLDPLLIVHVNRAFVRIIPEIAAVLIENAVIFIV